MLERKPSFPYQICFPDFDVSKAVKYDVESYLAKLERYHDRIVSCQIAVRAPHQHQRRHIYEIHIQLNLPGRTLIVDHEPGVDYSHADIHIAIRDAFQAMGRRLKDYMELYKGSGPRDRRLSS